MSQDPLLYEPPAPVRSSIPGMTDREMALNMFGIQAAGVAIVVLRDGVWFGVVEVAAMAALVVSLASFFTRHIKALRSQERGLSREG